MTAPGDATEVGSIVGYLILNRSDWSAGVRETQRDADKLGRLSPSIRIQTNTGEVLGQLALVDAAARKVGKTASEQKPFVMNLWAALAAAAPAGVPIAGVAGGALLGLLPTIAAVTFGIKGIEKAEKSGALAGTQYARDLAMIHTEGQKLQTLAAGGLLSGLDQAAQSAHPLFRALNQDIGATANQIGTMVGSGFPALLTILHQLSPLFTTIGDELDRGAAGLERWAQNSDGVSRFVAYVQAELPQVEHFLGNVVTLFAHLAEGAAPFGGVLLSDLTLFVHVLDAIPVGVLRDAIPAATSLYVALKAYQGVTAIMAGVNTLIAAVGRTWSSVTAGNAAAEAASVAAVKTGELEKAQAALASAQLRQRLVQAVNASLASEAEAAVVSAQAQVEASAEAAGAAQANAAKLAAANEASSFSWASMLGPVGAVVAGVGLFASALLGGSQAAEHMREEVNQLTDAIRQDNGAIGENTRAYVVNTLQKAGALDAARKLHISLEDVTAAALGNTAAMDLITLQTAKYTIGTYGATKDTHDLNAAARTLLDTLTGQNSAVGQAVQAYHNEQAALGSTTAAVHSQVAALQKLAAAMAKVEQQQLSQAQSEDQFRESVMAVTKQLKGHHDQLDLDTAKGLANRDAILSSVQAALSYRDAQEKAGVGTRKANLELASNIQSLIKAAVQAGANRKAILDMLGPMGLIPKDIRTKFALDGIVNVETQIRTVRGLIEQVQGNHVVGFTVGAAPNGRTAGVKGQATGGPVNGPGPRGVDSVLRLLAPGEYVVNDKAVAAITHKYGPGAMAAINKGELPAMMPNRSVAAIMASAPAPAPLSMPSARVSAGGAGSSASAALAAAQAALTPAAIRAAIHGAALVVDLPGVGTLNAHIDSRARAAASDYAGFGDDLYGMSVR